MGTTDYAAAVKLGALNVARLVEAVFPPSLWATMVAIADAESTFNASGVNAGRVGLFQILPLAGRPSASALLNPATNVRTAWALYNQPYPNGGLQPWAGDGYPAYVPVAEQIVQATVQQMAQAPTVARTIASASGSVTLSNSGIVTARLTLKASGGGVAYRVATALISNGQSVAAFAPNPVTGELAGNQVATVVQTRQVAAAPQLRTAGGGQVTLNYGVRWTVTNTLTNQATSVATSASAIRLVV